MQQIYPDGSSVEIDYSNISLIKRAIRYLNQLYGVVYYSGDCDLLEFLLDIQIAMKNCELPKMESEYLELWMDGYTEKEIADIKGAKQPVVHRSITNACKKFSAYLVGGDPTCI